MEKYISDLHLYSIKYLSRNTYYSIHITSIVYLKKIIKEADKTYTYTDINVFDIKNYNQSVYRKWIIETKYLVGNYNLKLNLIRLLESKVKPIKQAKNVLRLRIINNINYFHEIVEDNFLARKIVAGQIVNNLINYCYVCNNTYYGTVKYINDDFKEFKIESEICKITLELVCNAADLNDKNLNQLLSKLLFYIKDKI